MEKHKTKFKVGDEVMVKCKPLITYAGKICKVTSTKDGYAWINLFREDTKDAVEDDWIEKVTKLHKALL